MSIKALNAVDANQNTTTITIASELDSSEIVAYTNHTNGSEATFLNTPNLSVFENGGVGSQVTTVHADNGIVHSPGHYGVIITNEQNGDIKLRNLNPQDIPELKEVCSQWFPIE